MKLFVSNFPYHTVETELEYIFTPFNVRHVTIIKNHETGLSRGFGFVDVENGEAAIEALNGREFGGRDLTVKPAHKRSATARDAMKIGG